MKRLWTSFQDHLATPVTHGRLLFLYALCIVAEVLIAKAFA